MNAFQHRRPFCRFFSTPLALAIAVTASSAQSQQLKPDPLPIEPPPIALGYSTAKPDPLPIQFAELGPDLYAFSQAYAAAGEPRMLVIVGRDTRTFDQRGAVVTGLRSDASEKVVGGDLNLIDNEANAMKLQADLESLLLRTPGMDLVDVDALTEADRRTVQLLLGQGQGRAVDALASKLNAEVVLLVRMIDSEAVRAKGARYRVVVDAVETSRGRKLGVLSFDWLLGTDSRTIKRYAHEIGRVFMEDFAASTQLARPTVLQPAIDAPRRVSVRLVGLTSAEQLRAARNALSVVAGVSGVRTRGMSASGGVLVATVDVTFAGDSIDLALDATSLLAQRHGLVLEATDVQSGVLTLARPLPEEQQQQRGDAAQPPALPSEPQPSEPVDGLDL